MIYESEHCYPDLFDLETVLGKIHPGLDHEEKTALATKIYQDFRVSYEWLKIAMHACHSVGKHYSRPLLDVKSYAEEFVGRQINPEAFLAAATISGRKLRYAKRGIEETDIKTPPFDNAKITPLWKRHLEQESVNQKLAATNK